VAEVERLEHKSRRPDILVDDELIHAFYDARIPPGHHKAPTSSSWRKRRRNARSRSCCTSARDELMRHEAAGITSENFPPTLELGPTVRARVPLRAGSARDGVTMTVPLPLLNQVPAARANGWFPGC
jgi:ATP-dependent helicase HrpA